VLAWFNRFILLPTTIGALGALCGCSSFDSTSTWFSKRPDFFGKGGYTYSDLGDARRDRPITANDLIDGNGSCPSPVAPPSAQAGAAADDSANLIGQGVAIGMSECDVVQHLGQPNNVNLGQNPNGARAAVLTYSSGARPGVYRFVGGRLTEMDRVEQPPQAEQKAPPKKLAKKKPAQPPQPAKSGSSS
jgi:hypothetical protein